MMGNNAAGGVQQQQSLVKPDPDSQAGVSNRAPLAGGPAVNGKTKRAPARRGKRSMYDTDSSSEEEDDDEDDKEQSDDEDDEVQLSMACVIVSWSKTVSWPFAAVVHKRSLLRAGLFAGFALHFCTCFRACLPLCCCCKSTVKASKQLSSQMGSNTHRDKVFCLHGVFSSFLSCYQFSIGRSQALSLTCYAD